MNVSHSCWKVCFAILITFKYLLFLIDFIFKFILLFLLFFIYFIYSLIFLFLNYTATIIIWTHYLLGFFMNILNFIYLFV